MIFKFPLTKTKRPKIDTDNKRRPKSGYARFTIMVTRSAFACTVGAIRATVTNVADRTVVAEEAARAFRDKTHPKMLTYRYSAMKKGTYPLNRNPSATDGYGVSTFKISV
jgi:hypothetical protein